MTTEPSLRGEAWPFLSAGDCGLCQPIALIWTGQTPPPESVTVDGAARRAAWTVADEQQAAGTAVLSVASAEGPREVEIAAGALRACVRLEPVRPWEIFLVPHSHVDIGYTEFPDVLTDAHGDYVAQALDIMNDTDGLPEEARYRWTCESSWTVEQFLRRHPRRAEEFARRCREGRMELTAMYVNMTDLFTERLMEEAVGRSCRLRDSLGVPMVSACNYDVNGFGWALPGILARNGVKYLDVAINETRALGVRPKPAPLRWASPDGSSVLLWHAWGYGVGNQCLLHISAEQAEPRLAAFLGRMVRAGYPHGAMQMLTCGVTGDSTPPSPDVCRVVTEWNRKWSWPKLRLATVRDWFEHLERHWPEPVATHRKAWPDWWADGNGSALFEAALTRQTQARLADLEAQREVLRSRRIPTADLQDSYDEAWRRTMLFCEHTWGPYETSVRPYSKLSRGQWHAKASHAYAADALADSIALEQMAALASRGRVSARRTGLGNATLQGTPSGLLAGSDPPAVLVFNPLPEVRSDAVEVHCPGHLTAGRPPRLRDARTGQEVPVEVARFEPQDVINRSHYRLRFVAPDLPPRGHATFWIEPGRDAPACAPVKADQPVLDGLHYQVRIDPTTGAVAGILHKRTGRQLVQQAGPYLLNQFIHETIDDPRDRYALAWWGGKSRQVAFRRSAAEATGMEVQPGSGCLQRMVVRCQAAGGILLRTEIVLNDLVDRVDLINTLDKPPTVQAEAIYHAFPLLSPGAQIHLEVAGGVIRPWLDQVAGSASDWHSVQDWFAVSDDGCTVVAASPDVPLVQCGGINTGKWLEDAPRPGGLVMSWVLNNYWFTNFPAYQGGQVTYRYGLTLLEGPFDPSRAPVAAAAVRHPAWGYAVRMSPGP